MAEPEGAPASESTQPEAPAANVREAIRRVMRDLPGIGKLSPEQHKKAREASGQKAADDKGISYSYRSIEQITGHTQALFARHGVVLVPAPVPKPEVRAFTMGQSGTRWEDVTQPVYYWALGPGECTLHRQRLEDGTVDYWYEGDVLLAGPFIGMGRDNSDKGYNKALTMAEKQCLLQLLQIGDPGEDPDNQRHLDEGSRPSQDRTASAAEDERPWFIQMGYESQEDHAEKVRALQEATKALNEANRGQVGGWLRERGYVFTEGDRAGQPRVANVLAADAPVLAELIRALMAQEAQGAAGSEGASPDSAGSDGSVGAPDAPEPGAVPPEHAGNPEGPSELTGADPGQSEDQADTGASAGAGEPQRSSGRRPRNPR